MLDKYREACLTNWGAVLGVNKKYNDGLIWVSDPDSVDAGQIIGNDEVKLLWRLKEFKVRTNEDYKGIPEGAGIYVQCQTEFIYYGVWPNGCESIHVGIPRKICTPL